MDQTVTGSSAAAAVDPDRLVIRSFESPTTDSPLPISIVTSDPHGHSVTFCLHHHDHTLGNALRWQIMQYSEVEVGFCGYTVPHPSEAKVHLRVQVAEGRARESGVTAVTILKRALADLSTLYARLRVECGRAFDAFEN